MNSACALAVAPALVGHAPAIAQATHPSRIERRQAQFNLLARDTLAGVSAFAVPGNDLYSLWQGLSTFQVGGVAARIRMDFPPLMLHMQSSMRMGANAADSVLDADAEARWVKRLYVANNAALANACGGMNPTLTTQALATRTAEKIFQRYFGGQAWVEGETPLSSVDARVTQAVQQRGL